MNIELRNSLLKILFTFIGVLFAIYLGMDVSTVCSILIPAMFYFIFRCIVLINKNKNLFSGINGYKSYYFFLIIIPILSISSYFSRYLFLQSVKYDVKAYDFSFKAYTLISILVFLSMILYTVIILYTLYFRRISIKHYLLLISSYFLACIGTAFIGIVIVSYIYFRNIFSQIPLIIFFDKYEDSISIDICIKIFLICAILFLFIDIYIITILIIKYCKIRKLKKQRTL